MLLRCRLARGAKSSLLLCCQAAVAVIWIFSGYWRLSRVRWQRPKKGSIARAKKGLYKGNITDIQYPIQCTVYNLLYITY